MILKDSGTRRDFASGAVRDLAEGKGRCDLLPLDVVYTALGEVGMLADLEMFQRTGDLEDLNEALVCAIGEIYEGDMETAMLEAAKQYEDGAAKYAERNWEKGMPTHCYIDSAVRHYLKWRRGDQDEPHGRAVIWNLLCLWWTVIHRPEMNDLPIEGGTED